MKSSARYRSKVLLGVLLVFLWMIPYVAAAAFFPPILSDMIHDIFTKIPGNPIAMRSLLGILMFCVYWYVTSLIFVDKDPKRFAGVRITMSIVLAIITAIGIPTAILIGIFGDSNGGGVYGTTAGLLLLLGPMVGLGFLGFHVFKKQEGVFGKLFLVLIVSIMLALIGVAQKELVERVASSNAQPYTKAVADVISYMTLIFTLIWVFAFISLISGIAGAFRNGSGPAGAVTGAGVTPGAGRVTTGPGASGGAVDKDAKKAEKLVNPLVDQVKKYVKAFNEFNIVTPAARDYRNKLEALRREAQNTHRKFTEAEISLINIRLPPVEKQRYALALAHKMRLDNDFARVVGP